MLPHVSNCRNDGGIFRGAIPVRQSENLWLTPIQVLLSFIIGGILLTLLMAPLLVASLVLAAILSTVIISDGESSWLEGMSLIGLICYYCCLVLVEGTNYSYF
jgi:hypothetical protein